jgi:hypothetical protein
LITSPVTIDILASCSAVGGVDVRGRVVLAIQVDGDACDTDSSSEPTQRRIRLEQISIFYLTQSDS